jgi:hypothetical protein
MRLTLFAAASSEPATRSIWTMALVATTTSAEVELDDGALRHRATID